MPNVLLRVGDMDDGVGYLKAQLKGRESRIMLSSVI
jgi:hypothetical protein